MTIIIIDVRTVVLNEKKKKVKLEIVGSSHRAIVRDTPALKRASLEKKIEIALAYTYQGGKQVSVVDFTRDFKFFFASFEKSAQKVFINQHEFPICDSFVNGCTHASGI